MDFLENRINSNNAGSINAGLHTKAVKKMDLSHFWQQHIFVIKGDTIKDTALCCIPLQSRSSRFPALLHYTTLKTGSTLYYKSCIIYKHAVALKAINPRDLKNKDIIRYQLFCS
jgi:hypothetical protein